MADRKPLPGKFTWFELVSGDANKAQTFYGEVLGWKVESFPMGPSSYDMILAGSTLDTMIGGYVPCPNAAGPARWLGYVSVEDVDATVAAVTANGGKVLEPPSDIPGVGRRARIADPQGAELCVMKNSSGDPPDPTATQPGRFVWNELHTTHPEQALAFYEKVLGFSHRTMDMGPAGAYHVLSRGGVDRGGVTSHLPAGVAPHWLPYVAVDDPDGTVARARRLGAKVPVAPIDIPGVGRMAALEDPTGAALAMLKPLPRENGA